MNMYATSGTGLLATASAPVVTFLSSPYSDGREDIQFSCDTRSFNNEASYYVSIVQIPYSRGNVTLQSANYSESPLVNMGLGNNSTDWLKFVWGIEQARQCISVYPLNETIAAEVSPGPQYNTTESLIAWLQSNAYASLCHYSGTSKMGDLNTDPMAVVDSNLRVKGVHHLRVVDTSIMPYLTTGNIAATAIMIAHKGADLILNEEDLNR